MSTNKKQLAIKKKELAQKIKDDKFKAKQEAESRKFRLDLIRFDKKLDEKQSIKAEKRKLKRLGKPTVINPVKLRNETKVGSINNYSKYRFEYDNVFGLKTMYEAYKDAIKRRPLSNFITLHFFNGSVKDTKKRSFGRTISIDPIIDEQSFMDEINSIKEKLYKNNKNAYSDSKYSDDDILIYNIFDLSGVSIKGFGSSDRMLFVTENIETKNKKNCGYECFVKAGVIDDQSGTDPSKLIRLDDMITFIKNNKIKASIISNSISGLPNIDYPKLIDKYELKKMSVMNGLKKINTLGFTMKIEDYQIDYLYKAEDTRFTIVYDEVDKHYDLIKNNEIKFVDKLYMLHTWKVVKDGKIIFIPKELNINNKCEKKTIYKYIFFDYETVIDFNKNSTLMEYSLSILILNQIELDHLTHLDNESNNHAVEELRKNKCITFTGYDCTKQFCKWILQNDTNTKFTLVSFNGVNFDNFLLLDSMLDIYKDADFDFQVNQIFYSNNQLLNFHFCGRHDLFDLHKHLMGSLAYNCESFKNKVCIKKKDLVNFNQMQALHENGLLMDFIKDYQALKDYNEYDVLSLAVLFNKYKQSLYQIDEFKEISNNLIEYKTVGSIIWNVFQNHCKNNNYVFPKIPFKYYKDLQKYKVAGRVDLFENNIIPFTDKIVGEIASPDACSLYPYTMAVMNIYYPMGNCIIEVDKYIEGQIGFYYCDIDQSNLMAVNLPIIYPEKLPDKNNWATNNILNNYLVSSEIIKLLKKNNCKVTIKNGFIFDNVNEKGIQLRNKVKSCELFSFILNLMNAKNAEDTKKEKKDPTYNSALRETLKLLMNSLSGKLIEGLHTEKTIDVNNIAQYTKIKDAAKKINCINTVGDKIFLTYEIEEEDICDSEQRPIFLAILIYDYSKVHMYNYSYSIIGLDQLLYSDTDATKCRIEAFNKWAKHIEDKQLLVPHWPEVEKYDERYKTHLIYQKKSKVFGSFENELEDMKGVNYTFYRPQKKCWAYIVKDENNNLVIDNKGNPMNKFRLKGVNTSDLLLDGDEKFIFFKGSKIEHQEDLYEYCCNNPHKSINNNVEKFFEQLHNDKYARVLCHSFKKIVKNSLHNVAVEDSGKFNKNNNTIQANYSVKKISIT